MSVSSRQTGDGSFARSTSTAMLRGAVLIGVAVVVGLVLLSQGLDDSDTTVRTAEPGDSATTAATTGGDDGGTAGTGGTTTTAGPVKPPNEVKVLVANASGVKGAAGGLSEQLKTAGYVVLEPDNANGANVAATTVFHAEGFQREAALVARSIGANPGTVQALPVPAPVDDTMGTNVLIVLGTDLAKPA